MDEGDVHSVVSKQEAALEMLRVALEACCENEATPGDILLRVRARTLGEDAILIDGPVFEQLRDEEAASIIRTIYGALAEGATLSFTDAERKEDEIRQLCSDAGIANSNVTITGEAKSRRVSIARLQ